jgi:hypothetical protein
MARQFSDLTPAGRKFFRELKKLQDLEVQVGFQGDQKYEDGTSIAEVAAYNEFGSSDTPERPFMRQSFENHEAELKAGCEAANRVVNSGGSAEQALQQLGTLAKGLVQDEIVNGGFAPNAESTIQKKGSERPLIDSGTMRESVNFVIKRRGG